MEQENINARSITVAETGWHEDEVRQILSILFRHHTWTRSEFADNFDRVWAKEEYNALSPRISAIRDTILSHDVEAIHYKIKHAQSIDEFSDCIINMVDEMIDDTKNEASHKESDDIRRIYEGIAECFIFDRETEDLILELQHWMCNNCGNCNVNMMIDSKQTTRITICILCGLSQQQQIVLKLKNQDTYMMVNSMNSVEAEDPEEMKESDEIDAMIKEILTKGFKLQCPNQNDNHNCVAIMRLTKILIKYKRWLYTIHKKDGKDGIERTVKVDIAKFVNDEEFQQVFRQNMKAIGIIAPQDFESAIQSIDHVIRDISDPKTFLQLDEDIFVEIVQKHIHAVPKVFALKLHWAINRKLKRIDAQNIDHEVFSQIIMDYLKTMQTTSRSLQEALDHNSNDIARIQTFLSARRKRFGKIIQKEGKTSLPMSLKLYDKILYAMKQKAQTQQFGEFLSDLDMERITQDYHHILKVHIREGDKTCIENCFRYFEYAVHFDDNAFQKEQCRSAKRKEDRIHQVIADTHDQIQQTQAHRDHKHDVFNDEQNKDIWRLKQYYIQSQLDIIHSYLVHSKWERVVQRYCEKQV
eukprot:479624_1